MGDTWVRRSERITENKKLAATVSGVKRHLSGSSTIGQKAAKLHKGDEFRSNKMADKGTSVKRHSKVVDASANADPHPDSDPDAQVASTSAKIPRYDEDPISARVTSDGNYIDGLMKYPYPNEDDLIDNATKSGKFRIFLLNVHSTSSTSRSMYVCTQNNILLRP